MVNYMFLSNEYIVLSLEYYSKLFGFRLAFNLRYKICETGNQSSEKLIYPCLQVDFTIIISFKNIIVDTEMFCSM